jgi:hypothetical protein
MSSGYRNIFTILLINNLFSIISYKNKIISLYFNCKGETPTLVLHFYLIIALMLWWPKLQAEKCRSERDE